MGSPSVYVLLLLVDERICFSQWLSRIEQGGSSKEIEKERVGRVEVKPCSLCQIQRLQKFAGKPQPHGNTQINKNRLI